MVETSVGKEKMPVSRPMELSHALTIMDGDAEAVQK
jgi:hypothetical protein